MKKIVFFNGSPRKNGYSVKIMNKIIEGAKSKGAEIIICNLNDDGVKGCQGCLYCKSHTECITKDTMSPALEALRTADAFVASFPIYFGHISGQSKLFLDRLYSFFNKDFSAKHPDKKFVTIFSQGSPMEGAYDSVSDIIESSFNRLGWNKVIRFNANGTNFGEELTEELLEKAFEAGCNLAE